MNHIEKALEYFRKALSLASDNSEFHYCLATTLSDKNELESAIHHFKTAIRLLPHKPDYHWNFSLTLLKNGDFKQAWEHFEWRWRLDYFTNLPETLGKPLWSGQALNEQSIFIYAEQGLGDTLQFVRYLPLIPKTSGKIYFQCQAPLIPLLKIDFPDIEYSKTDDPMPNGIDVQAPLMSLPGIMGTQSHNIPSNIPYLHPEPERQRIWKHKIETHAKSNHYKIGIVWAGNPDHARDKERSCSLDHFQPLFELPNLQWFSLQKERNEEAADYPKIINLMDEVNDFSDTAAFISQLDLIISVDTSVVHLAGAMGIPTFVLLAYSPDWRWLLEKNTSDWYPSLRLFRQAIAFDWYSVFADIAFALENITTRKIL
jgi:tetratricopeptide (TPR) repeat protein